VAGTARGHRLVAPRGTATRPTSDRVRESLFNALASYVTLEDAVVLDAFAGTGALGIEALSRGAGRAVFVEQDRTARTAVERNLGTTGTSERARVVASDVEAWLRLGAGGEHFDIAFLDPPYAYDTWPALMALVPADLAVVESDREVPLGGWHVAWQRRYGTTLVSFARPPGVVPGGEAHVEEWGKL